MSDHGTVPEKTIAPAGDLIGDIVKFLMKLLMGFHDSYLQRLIGMKTTLFSSIESIIRSLAGEDKQIMSQTSVVVEDIGKVILGLTDGSIECQSVIEVLRYWKERNFSSTEGWDPVFMESVDHYTNVANVLMEMAEYIRLCPVSADKAMIQILDRRNHKPLWPKMKDRNLLVKVGELMFGLADNSISHFKLMDAVSYIYRRSGAPASPFNGAGTFMDRGIHLHTFYHLITLLQKRSLPYQMVKELLVERWITKEEHRDKPRYEVVGLKECGYVVIDTSTRQVI